MRLQSNRSPERAPSLIATLAMAAAVFGCLALSPRTLKAGDGGGEPPMSLGGGDAIGSLPYHAAGLPPQSIVAQAKPSIVLQGPNLAAIQGIVIDAWGDGYAEVTDAGEAGIRVEFQGEVGLLIDRNQLNTAGVSFGLDVSQGFSGGLGVITQGQHLVRSQALPAEGDLDLPLGMLSASGALDTGGLTVHTYNPAKQHRALEILGSGGTLRLISHE